MLSFGQCFSFERRTSCVVEVQISGTRLNGVMKWFGETSYSSMYGFIDRSIANLLLDESTNFLLSRIPCLGGPKYHSDQNNS